MTKRLFYLSLNVEGNYGAFLPRVLMKRNQGVFLPWILRKGDQGTFLPRNKSCDDQRVFLPRSWWKVTKRLFYLETEATIVLEDLFIENLLRRFFLLWRCDHGDLSFEDLFIEMCPLKIYLGDFSFWGFVKEIFPFMKMCSWGFILWRFVHGDLSF